MDTKIKKWKNGYKEVLKEGLVLNLFFFFFSDKLVNLGFEDPQN